MAADPPLDGRGLASLLHAVAVPVPAGALRALVAGTWHLRLQPTDPGWLDLVLQSPLVDTGRARRELGWTATRSPQEVFEGLLAGMRHRAEAPTPLAGLRPDALSSPPIRDAGPHLPAFPLQRTRPLDFWSSSGDDFDRGRTPA